MVDEFTELPESYRGQGPILNSADRFGTHPSVQLMLTQIFYRSSQVSHQIVFICAILLFVRLSNNVVLPIEVGLP